MKLLVFSFYFPPDLCAGSFRCGALADALERRAPPGFSVDVVTTQPNRYKGAVANAPAFEDRGGLRVHRIALPDHDSGMADQAKAFATFAGKALSTASRCGPHDAVFATTSRLMTGALAALHARRIGAPLYLDVRDLFADTMTDVLAASRVRTILPAVRQIERLAYRQADRVNVVSPGFIPDVTALAPQAALRTFTNGIDDEFLTVPPGTDERVAGKLPTILYAGNIGEGQGLECVVPDAAQMLLGKAKFRVIGQGGRLARLRSMVSNLGNVELLPAIPRDRLLAEYAAADVLFLHLNDYRAFRKVLPSKLFEYGAMGHPILAGLAGESAEFLQRELPGSGLFRPCDAAGLVDAFTNLGDLGRRDRSEFRTKFARRAIMDRMADDLVAFVAEAARQ